MNEDAVKKLTRQGSMVSKEAADEMDLETAERFEELSDEGSTPMFVSGEMEEKISDNKGFAEALHNTSRSERAKAVDENKQAEKVFEEPVTDGELETWRENPDEYDINGVDTVDEILFSGDDL